MLEMMNASDEGVVTSISKAARERKTIIIKYKGKKGDISTRETEPYEIKNGSYFGYDLGSDSIKNFKLTNILGTERTESSFSPRWSVKF